MNAVKPEGRLLRTIELTNGLTIHFYDQSKPVAGDRYQVRLCITIPVVIKAEHFQELADYSSAYKELTAAFGKVVAFSLEKVRNFVAANEVDTTLDQMSQEFLRSNLTYVSSDKFPTRFVVKKYLQWKEEEGYRRKHLQAIRNAE